nr:hypothetical protein [Tanacetum cinerariifolium]
MAALPICDELRRAVNLVDWEPQFIFYYRRAVTDDVRLARQINALCDTLTDVIERKESFVAELEMLGGKFVPGKMAEFMKDTLNKDVPNLMKLQNLGREFELWTTKKNIFIEKLKDWCLSTVSEEVQRFGSGGHVILQLQVCWDLSSSMLLRLMIAELYVVTYVFRNSAGGYCNDDWREANEESERMHDYRRLSDELRESVRTSDGYIKEMHKLQMYDSSDEVLESIKILKSMQVDDMEKASRLIFMAREVQNRVYEKNSFIRKLRG